MHALKPTVNRNPARQWEWKVDDTARTPEEDESVPVRVASIAGPSFPPIRPSPRVEDQGLTIDRLIDELDQAFGAGISGDPEPANAGAVAPPFPVFAEDQGEPEEAEREPDESGIDGQPLIFADQSNAPRDVSTDQASEPGFWHGREEADAKPAAEPRTVGKIRHYYLGGTAASLLAAAGIALALQSTGEPAVTPPIENPLPAVATAEAGGNALAEREPLVGAPAGDLPVFAPGAEGIDPRASNGFDPFAVLPALAAMAGGPVAGDRRVEAGEPLGHRPGGEDLGNQAAAAVEEASAGAAVVVETTIIPVPTPAVTTAWVNLRAGPENGADVLMVVGAGVAVQVIECDRWCHVIADGRHGWIHRDFVDGDMLPPRTDGDARGANVGPFTATAVAWLRIYDSPFEDRQVATSVRAGSEILIVGCDLNWCEIRFGPDGRRGWVDRLLVGLPTDITEAQIPPLPPINRDDAAAM